MKILKSLPEKEKSELPKLIKSLIDNDDRKNTLRKYFYIYRRNILEPLKPSDDKKKIEQKPSKEEDIIKTDKKEVKPEIQEKPKKERKDKTPEKQEEKEIIEPIDGEKTKKKKDKPSEEQKIKKKPKSKEITDEKKDKKKKDK